MSAKLQEAESHTGDVTNPLRRKKNADAISKKSKKRRPQNVSLSEAKEMLPFDQCLVNIEIGPTRRSASQPLPWSYAVAAAGLVLVAPQVMAQTFPSEIDLSELAAGDGSTGFVLNGADMGGLSGRSVSAVGDMNGDGIVDLLIGAPDAHTDVQVSAGVSYLVFGRDAASGFPAEFELSALAAGDGSSGFVLYGDSARAKNRAGLRVSGGDINGDGIDDLIIGESRRTFIVFGRSAASGGFPAEFHLASLASGDGSTGFVFNGLEWVSGESADINDDGIDELIVGGYMDNDEYPNYGAYVTFGRSAATGGFPAEIGYDHLGNSSDGFLLNSWDVGDGTGYVTDTGDVNGDGLDDLLLGAPYGLYVLDCGGTGCGSPGAVRVIYGRDRSTNFPGKMHEDLRLSGEGVYNLFGNGVAAGDINGDGIDDMAIGQPVASPGGREYAGATYVVYGRERPAGTSLEYFDLDALVTGDGSTGFVVNGVQANSRAGEKVALGDVNGDGREDIIIGTRQHDLSRQVYVVFGRDAAAGGFPAEFELSSLAEGDGSDGFVLDGLGDIDGGGLDGTWISAGDINGDGVDDLILGDGLADLPNRNNAGKTYVVFGRSAGPPTGPTLSLDSNTSAVEGDYLQFKVKLSQAVNDNVSYRVTTVDGTAITPEDYEDKGGDRLMAPGETEQTLWVGTLDDQKIEENETLRLKLSQPANAELGKASAKGTIVDNDDTRDWARLTVANARAAEGGRAIFGLTVSKPTKEDVKIGVETLDVTATANKDYAPKGGVRIIPAGETRDTIFVDIPTDNVIEGVEKFRLRIEVRSNNAVVKDGEATATGTITGP